MFSNFATAQGQDKLDLSVSEFLAEKEYISIIPNFNSPFIRLLRETVGPFEAGLRVDVQLWIAIHLKQRQKCRIVPPDWLKVEFLETLRETETNGHLFAEMPNPNYMEIAQLLLQYAGDDIPQSSTIKTLICDISDVRMAKLRNNMDIFVKSEGSYAQVNNLTQFEICRIRDFFTSALNHLQILQEAAKSAPDEDDANGRLFLT
jgi:GINS complex subunit 2